MNRISRAGAVSWLTSLIMLGVAGGAGLLSAAVPQLLVAAVSVAVPVGLLYWVIARCGAPEASERRFLCQIFLLALALRFAVATITYLLLPYGFFAPDEAGYTFYGAELASSGLGSPADVIESVHGWLYVNAVFIHFLGSEAGLLIRLLNTPLGALLPVLSYKLATQIGGSLTAARLAAGLTAAFPSLVLWSSLNLKDAAIHVLILGTLLLGLQLQKRFRVQHVFLIVLLLAMTSVLRPYLLLPLIIGVLVAQLVARRQVFANLFAVVGVAALLVVPLALWLPGLVNWYLHAANLESVQTVRVGFASGAGSSFLGSPAIRTPLDLLRFLPSGLLHFFLGPFPWSSAGTLHGLTEIEMLMYYLLLPFCVVGIRRALVRRASAALPVLAFMGVLALGYAAALANFGTVFRLRGQLLVLMLCFAALGLSSRAARPARKATAVPQLPPASLA